MALMAKVYFEKLVTKDNWEEGCIGNHWCVYNENFTIHFEHTKDLISKLGDYISRNFDVDKDEFIKYANNECEENRIDYCQGEDADGDKFAVTQENPNGYLADYMFHIDVYEEVDFDFRGMLNE